MATAPVPPTAPKPKAEADDKKTASATPSLSLETGETTIDDKLTFEVDLACYGQMRALAAQLATRVSPRLAGTATAHLFFLDAALRSALDLAVVLEIQLRNLKDAYHGVGASVRTALGPLTALPAATVHRTRIFALLPALATRAVADAAVALLGAIRTDVRYLGRQTVIAEPAFALALAHQWEGRGDVVFHYPSLFVPPEKAGRELLVEFLQALDAVVEERKEAGSLLAQLLAAVGHLPANDPKLSAAKAGLEAARDQFQAAEAVFADFSAKIAKTDESTGLTQLQLVERAAFVKSLVKDCPGRAFFLFAQVVAAGGSYRIVKNFFRSLFCGDGLYHSGGCILTFGLFDAHGRLLAADTVGRRSRFTRTYAPLSLEDSE